jgi:hypothetical protein
MEFPTWGQGSGVGNFGRTTPEGHEQISDVDLRG